MEGVGRPAQYSPASRERRAWHEAGHAVGYWYSGFNLARVRLVGDGEGVTEAIETDEAHQLMARLGADAWLTSLPGNAVEVVRGELELDRAACRLIDRTGLHLETGATHVDAVVEDIGAERALELWDQAIDLVHGCWSAVETVAVALLQSPDEELGTNDLARLRNHMPLMQTEMSGVARGNTAVSIVSDVPGRE